MLAHCNDQRETLSFEDSESSDESQVSEHTSNYQTISGYLIMQAGSSHTTHLKMNVIKEHYASAQKCQDRLLRVV